MILRQLCLDSPTFQHHIFVINGLFIFSERVEKVYQVFMLYHAVLPALKLHSQSVSKQQPTQLIDIQSYTKATTPHSTHDRRCLITKGTSTRQHFLHTSTKSFSPSPSCRPKGREITHLNTEPTDNPDKMCFWAIENFFCGCPNRRRLEVCPEAKEQQEHRMRVGAAYPKIVPQTRSRH